MSAERKEEHWFIACKSDTHILPVDGEGGKQHMQMIARGQAKGVRWRKTGVYNSKLAKRC